MVLLVIMIQMEEKQVLVVREYLVELIIKMKMVIRKDTVLVEFLGIGIITMNR